MPARQDMSNDTGGMNVLQAYWTILPGNIFNTLFKGEAYINKSIDIKMSTITELIKWINTINKLSKGASEMTQWVKTCHQA